MLTIATMLWSPNKHSKGFSRCYGPEWVDKLYRGFKRHLTDAFEFVCFTDREYPFNEPVKRMPILSGVPNYGCYIEPFRLDRPSIIVGLDTVVTGNCDHFAEYCHTAKKVALPRDPNRLEMSCNGVALVPDGNRHIFDRWNGENDMEWLRKHDCDYIDDLFPGQVKSYKLHVKKHGIGDVRICFFHGAEKPHEINHPVTEHWR